MCHRSPWLLTGGSSNNAGSLVAALLLSFSSSALAVLIETLVGMFFLRGTLSPALFEKRYKGEDKGGRKKKVASNNNKEEKQQKKYFEETTPMNKVPKHAERCLNSYVAAWRNLTAC